MVRVCKNKSEGRMTRQLFEADPNYQINRNVAASRELENGGRENKNNGAGTSNNSWSGVARCVLCEEGVWCVEFNNIGLRCFLPTAAEARIQPALAKKMYSDTAKTSWGGGPPLFYKGGSTIKAHRAFIEVY